ncbi:MAG TPA: hypothetical protein DD789_06710 [Firmicutes bacterium]|mgnify:CR=1 FL=1|jgi:hypothetical protein|nr:hypothetical protein [Bacillota bacterium]
MPRTKLDQLISPPKPRKKQMISLADIPNLPMTLTVQHAADVAGVGYQEIRRRVELGEIYAIEVGEADQKQKRLIPTFEFLTSNRLCSESLLEKILLQRLEWERQERENKVLQALHAANQ